MYPEPVSGVKSPVIDNHRDSGYVLVTVPAFFDRGKAELHVRLQGARPMRRGADD
jgi:hypothetical protein